MISPLPRASEMSLFGRNVVETSVTQEVPMPWLATAVERAMKRQEVILRAPLAPQGWPQAWLHP